VNDLEFTLNALMSWCVVSAAGWVILAIRFYQGKPFLRYEPRREPPWGLGDLFVVLCIIFVPQMLVAKAFQPLMIPGTPAGEVLKQVLQWNALVSVISVFGVVAYLQFRPGASLGDVGIRVNRIAYQVGLGVACFLLIGPLVYGLQFVLVQLLEIPSEHPLIELVKEDAGAFRLSAFTAVIMAPISEELLFRGLLQGWLERLTLFDADSESFLLGFRPTDDEDDQLWQESQGGSRPVTWMPIIVSSAVFAALHFSHGPDPIPLFVLAVALGYVYQRTQRLLPCIIIHMCLNGMTMLMLWFSLRAPGA